jgi:hypothetical protein
MESIWRIGGYGMTDNRLRQLVYGGMILLTIMIWWSIWNFGFFITLFYLISCSFTIGIYLRYLENNNSKNNRR